MSDPGSVLSVEFVLSVLLCIDANTKIRNRVMDRCLCSNQSNYFLLYKHICGGGFFFSWRIVLHRFLFSWTFVLLIYNLRRDWQLEF